jgi:hypothetical protein
MRVALIGGESVVSAYYETVLGYPFGKAPNDTIHTSMQHSVIEDVVARTQPKRYQHSNIICLVPFALISVMSFSLTVRQCYSNAINV